MREEAPSPVEGDGQLEGRMSLTVCQLEPGPTPQDGPVADDCADLGEFTDIMLVMIGEYAPPEIGP